jgi:hypothetical protein
MADEAETPVAAPAPVEEVEMSVLDALKEVRRTIEFEVGWKLDILPDRSLTPSALSSPSLLGP